MNNVIHVQVQVVHFLSVWVWLCNIDRNLFAIKLSWFLFVYSGYDFRVLLGEPSEKGGNTHVGSDEMRKKSVKSRVSLKARSEDKTRNARDLPVAAD